MMWLYKNGIHKYDVLYSEPKPYKDREATKFSGPQVISVNQVPGYEGMHSTDNSNDLLILGVGYDHHLISYVAEAKKKASKVQLFGFPPLQADMFQENIINTKLAEESVGVNIVESSKNFYAPANDPFVTANVLRKIVATYESRASISNLYLSPLATKAQVLGFGLYYITERIKTPTSIIFPFCDLCARETTKGLTRIWKYTIETE